jgi:hypothetical protein
LRKEVLGTGLSPRLREKEKERALARLRQRRKIKAGQHHQKSSENRLDKKKESPVKRSDWLRTKKLRQKQN